MKNTPSRAFGNILFFSTKAAVIFKSKLKKKMAWADVASEVGLQNGKCCDKKGKSCLFRKISRTHKRLGLDLLFLCIRRLRLIRWRPRKKKEQQHQYIYFVHHLGILHCACALHCACVCVGRVNFLVLAFASHVWTSLYFIDLSFWLHCEKVPRGQ